MNSVPVHSLQRRGCQRAKYGYIGRLAIADMSLSTPVVSGPAFQFLDEGFLEPPASKPEESDRE